MEGGERRVKLLCQSLSKAVEIVAEDEKKVELGPIARAFGLDPNTLKLNGYFIARGPDHIASSLTWKSLLRFFSDRRLPAGAAAPLLVDGKLSKIGSKRSHELEEVAKAKDSTKEMGSFRENKRPQHEHRSSNTGLHKSSGSFLKRKSWLEDESRLKRARSDEGRFSCSIISKNLKRMRIDEIVAASPLKKLR